MTRKLSSEMLALEAAAEKRRPSAEAAFELGPIREHDDTQYTLMSDDILIQNGTYAGKRISELVKTVAGRDYVGHMWKAANKEMRDVIRRYFSE